MQQGYQKVSFDQHPSDLVNPKENLWIVKLLQPTFLCVEIFIFLIWAYQITYSLLTILLDELLITFINDGFLIWFDLFSWTEFVYSLLTILPSMLVSWLPVIVDDLCKFEKYDWKSGFSFFILTVE